MLSSELLTILIVVGAAAYFLKYGKAQKDVNVLSELTSMLSKWELFDELAEIIDKLNAGKKKEAEAKAAIVVREFQNDKTALNKLSSSFDYQLNKRLADPIELARLKALISQFSKAHADHAKKVIEENAE